MAVCVPEMTEGPVAAISLASVAPVWHWRPEGSLESHLSLVLIGRLRRLYPNVGERAPSAATCKSCSRKAFSCRAVRKMKDFALATSCFVNVLVILVF